MALISPGVQVSVTDESQYVSSAANSTPLFIIATASNKANPTGTGVALGTTSSNAGKLFQITSQRDLDSLYGSPTFYNSSNGSPIHGYELNEYGLLAARSALGVTNSVFCLRADVDLAGLVGSVGRPVSNPANGTYWFDSLASTWGINEFNAATGKFVSKNPIVITDENQLDNDEFPLASIGLPGDYAVNAIPSYDYPTATTSNQFFYKNETNTWVAVGSTDWMKAFPTVSGNNAPTSLTAGNVLTIIINGMTTATFTVPSSPNNNLATLVSMINSAGYTGLQASASGGRLQIISSQTSSGFGNTTPFSVSVSGTGTVLADLGISSGTYYQPTLVYGTSAQQPLWQAGQATPMPTGSVWIKIGSAGSGLNSVISSWSSAQGGWVAKTPSYATSDWIATAGLDSTGGKNIPAGTVYAQYGFNGTTNGGYVRSPVYYWERSVTGPTVITGDITNPVFNNGPYSFNVSVSVPGSTTLSTTTVSLGDNTTGADFVSAWNSAAITNTIASLTDAGAIRLTHVQGGEIIISDFGTNGVSTGLIQDAGLIVGTTTGVKEGPSAVITVTTGQGSGFAGSSTSGVGTDFEAEFTNHYQNYYFSQTGFVSGGSGYAVNDTITIPGAALGGTTPANNLVLRVTSVDTGNSNAVTGVIYVSGRGAPVYSTQLSNWTEFDMTARDSAPSAAPSNMANWFYSVVDEVDIMVNTSTGWKGYRNVNFDDNGFPLPSGANQTDPNGPIISASEPETQSDGTALVYGDIWIDTSDLDNYPIINRWEFDNSVQMAKWTRIDNSNQVSSSGVLFADARWATTSSVNPASDPIPSIQALLMSDYLDLDAPDSDLYPVGMLLFNTRRSGYNVKQFRQSYFNAERFPDQVLPTQKDTWLTVSGNQANGSPFMGRKAQRALIVQAMRSAVDTNTAIRDEDNFFNLIAAPNYPELQPNMVVLNNDRGNTAYIIGDTPLRLSDDATEIQNWATNAAGAATTGEDGLVTRDSYLGLFYPSGMSNDLNGNSVVVPASHMMIRTFLRNDSVAYPWFAAAGTRRGTIDNATAIGYIDSVTGEFNSIKTRVGVRDVLYTNQINPLVFFTGNGLLNYGNKSSFASSSAMDRTNVARLVAYLRRQLTLAGRPFVFEQNTPHTRQQFAAIVQTLMVDLVAKSGITDYVVQCDQGNNTPDRIDRNELWLDLGVVPTRSAEFVLIPVRLLNTGELTAAI